MPLKSRTGKYQVLDKAIVQLKLWEWACEKDNGIRQLYSGGDTESINQWYKDIEAKRTPEQYAAEELQKTAWGDYAKVREEAMKLIKKAQSQPSARKFYTADYEGEFIEFKAPNMKLAKKFLQLIESHTYSVNKVLPASKATPHIKRMSMS